MIIYLGLLVTEKTLCSLPAALQNLRWPPIRDCTREGLHCPLFYKSGGGLLPRHFTLTRKLAVYFLLHFPYPVSYDPELRELPGPVVLWCPDFPHKLPE